MRKVLQDEVLFSDKHKVLAGRNYGTPLETLSMPITPVGLHYLLIHFDIPEVNASTFTLKLCGKILKSKSFSLEEIMERPSKSMIVTMECAGNGRSFLKPTVASMPWDFNGFGTAKWTGVPLRDILKEAVVDKDAVEVIFTGLDIGMQEDKLDYYHRSLSLEECMRDDVILAYKMNEQPLLPQHGFPLRLIVPGWYGMTSVKWLAKIEVVDKAFNGYQQRIYSIAKTWDDPNPEPIKSIKVRSLMVPPGSPCFYNRQRYITPGKVTLQGKAWTGQNKSITQVEVTIDDGKNWNVADLDPPLDKNAWCHWKWRWDATPGNYILAVRARDDSGDIQPVNPEWNTGGYSNNSIQKVNIIVKEYQEPKL